MDIPGGQHWSSGPFWLAVWHFYALHAFVESNVGSTHSCLLLFCMLAGGSRQKERKEDCSANYQHSLWLPLIFFFIGWLAHAKAPCLLVLCLVLACSLSDTGHTCSREKESGGIECICNNAGHLDRCQSCVKLPRSESCDRMSQQLSNEGIKLCYIEAKLSVHALHKLVKAFTSSSGRYILQQAEVVKTQGYNNTKIQRCKRERLQHGKDTRLQQHKSAITEEHKVNMTKRTQGLTATFVEQTMSCLQGASVSFSVPDSTVQAHADIQAIAGHNASWDVVCDLVGIL